MKRSAPASTSMSSPVRGHLLPLLLMLLQVDSVPVSSSPVRYDEINTFLTMAWQVANHTRPNSSCYVCGLTPYTAGEGLPLMALPISDCDTCRLLHISTPFPQSGCSSDAEMKMRPLNCSAGSANCYRCVETPKPVPVVLPQPLSWCLENKGSTPLGRSDCLQTYKWDPEQSGFDMNNFASSPQQCLQVAGAARLNALARRTATCSISSPVGMYWVCGNLAYPHLPVDYDGRCGLAYVVPAMRVTHSLPKKQPHPPHRSRRSLFDIFGTHHQSPWKNMIGTILPFYGVMSTLAQIGDLSAAVEVIASETGKALAMMSNELASVRLLALQNRAALDFLLAARGGTCAVIGTECCTFVPENNATIFDVIHHLKETGDTVRLVANQTVGGSYMFDWLTPALGPLAFRLVEVVLALTVFIVLLSLVSYCVRRCLFCCCKINS